MDNINNILGNSIYNGNGNQTSYYYSIETVKRNRAYTRYNAVLHEQQTEGRIQTAYNVQ